jgi:outer membrane protein OmpA-like peptidoglycan-associated protein
MRQARTTGTRNRQERVTFPVVVEFGRGSTVPRAESLVAMHAAAQWLGRHADEHVTVAGHANVRSSERSAAALARTRVAVVTDLLVLLGAERSQLVPLRSSRLHSVPVGSTLGARRQRRVVVIHRHDPPQLALGRVARRLSAALSRNAR